MNPNALQFISIDVTRMDQMTLLSFLHMIDNHGQADATMQAKMGQFWTDFHAAFNAYDLVINPERTSIFTAELKKKDEDRDSALGAYHEAILGLQRHPVEAKRMAAKKLLINYDSFNPDRSLEYMKETETIHQMVKEIENQPELTAAVTLLGLGDYKDDLKQKNDDFATTMATRTGTTEGQTKGAVAAARAAAEAKYQLFRQMLNVASIYEGDADYRSFILKANAEVEHYRTILARKGISTGGGSSTGQGQASPDPSQGGENGGQQTGGDNNQGGGTGTIDTGGTGGGTTGGDNGGSTGGGDNGGGGGTGSIVIDNPENDGGD